jgi:dTDP-4-amino-4,6-dideoxygalactose transaminase
MSIFREIPPTAGFPLYLKDLLTIFNQKNYQVSLGEDFRNYLDIPYARVTYSGTAAFYFILESLKNLSAKKTVIIPSYICPLVPLAIKKAGFRVAVCDINKDDFNFNIRQLEELCLKNSDILAIVAVHLGGIPVDFAAIKQIATQYGIFVIEDCAQALGAIYKGKKVGTLGDFSFFSLCRGKGLTIYEGGVIVTKSEENSKRLDTVLRQRVKNDFLSESLKIFELFGYWVFYRPQLFWFAFRLPQIYWDWRGERIRAAGDYFDADFPLHKVSKIRKLIGHINFSRLDEEIDKQRQKAFGYIERLKDIQGIKLITESVAGKATYPYLTLLFDDPLKRKKAQKIFAGLGLGVSQIYESAITDYGYLKDIIDDSHCPNARSLAEREVTLSTSTFLTKRDLDSVTAIIKKL